MASQYNGYVLSTCVEHGWITEEQRRVVEAAVQSNPGLSALDFLETQQMLSAKNIRKFREAIKEAEQVHSPVAASDGSGALAHVNDYLQLGQQYDASDIHLSVGMPPIMRRYGELQPMWEGAGLLTPEDTERLAMTFLDEHQKHFLRDRGDADYCYSTAFGRFRTSVVRQRRGIDIVFRIISSHLRTMDELGLPDHLKKLTEFTNGLVLVTGPVGSGKSTTLASFMDHVNKTRHDHIITLEDPIEYTIHSQNCHVSQREIVSHTRSFSSALRASLREDPDVIMVGEMRDLETISLAITAAETGHLVFATLHTASAARTLDRILDVFPTDQQDQIRVMVSESLRGIISQQLVPRADGHGRALALEVLLNNPAVAALIRDGKTFMLKGVVQTNRKMGMRLMDDSLMELVNTGYITGQEAYQRADDKGPFNKFINS